MHASALSVFRFPENTCIPQARPKAQGAVTEQSPGVAVMADLAGEKPMRQINERNILRHDLSVADVMTPLSKLDALAYDELKASTVAQVAATFKKLKHSHLPVVQAATRQGPARIRGVISLTQLERQLGRALPEAMPHS